MKRSKFPAEKIVRGATRVMTMKRASEYFGISESSLRRVLSGRAGKGSEAKVRAKFARNNRLSSAGWRYCVALRGKATPPNFDGKGEVEVEKVIVRLLRRAWRALPVRKRKKSLAYFQLWVRVKLKKLPRSVVLSPKSFEFKVMEALENDGI